MKIISPRGGSAHEALERIRRDYPLGLHGVGLSLASADVLDKNHLPALRHLIERHEPTLVSEHICWGAIGGRHLHDPLPLPYTEEALHLMIARVSQAQETLGCQLLLETCPAICAFAQRNARVGVRLPIGST